MNAKDLVSNYKNWVVIGDVSNAEKYAYRILKKFEDNSYTVSGVHYKGGENIYVKLEDVPHDIDVIDLCIHPVKGIDYVKQAKNLGIKYILIQPRAASTEILDYCKDNNITAVEGCALVALSQLVL